MTYVQKVRKWHENRCGQDSDTQFLDAISVLVNSSKQVHTLKKENKEAELKRIMAATETSRMFLDFAFSYLYNFVLIEILDERGDEGGKEE